VTGGTRNIAAHSVPVAERVPSAAEHAHNIHTVVTLAAIAALVWLAIYAGQCWWFPYGKCGRCKGAGILTDKPGKHFRRCPRCKGARRLRIGRRVLNHLTNARKDPS